MPWSVPPNTLFVLGAGVDYPLHVPTMATLMPEMRQFVATDGKKVHDVLRKNAPGLRFTLEREARKQGEGFGEMVIVRDKAFAKKVLDILEPHATDDKPGVKAVHTLVTKLANIRDLNEVDADTAGALQVVAGIADPNLAPMMVLDPRGLGLDPIAREAMSRVFRGLGNDIEGLSEDEVRTLGEAASKVTNVEGMMADHFIGFFTNDKGKQKNYYYLAWMLWAFIRLKQQELYANRDASLYPVLEAIGADDVLTFNYTDFFYDRLKGKVHYFHGSSDTYLRFDTRMLVENDDSIRDAKTVDEVVAFLAANKPDWSCEPSRVILPGIIPPVALKPIVSQQNLESWYLASQNLKKADAIIVIGYSFAVADEHFNQLLRGRKPGCRVIVVNPQAEIIAPHVCRVLGIPLDALQNIRKVRWDCKQADSLLLVPGYSDDLDAEAIEKLLT